MTHTMVEGLNIYMLARRLAAARDQAGLSQTDLALRCDLNLSNLNALERGKAAGVRGETLVRLARALGCSLDYLCGLTDDPRPRARSRQDDTGAGRPDDPTPPRRQGRRRAAAPAPEDEGQAVGV